MQRFSGIMVTLLVLCSCGSSHELTGGAHIEIDSTTNTIHIVNPIIEFCERLFPAVLYPDVVDRETRITECMRLCSESGQCTVEVPDFLNEGGVNP